MELTILALVKSPTSGSTPAVSRPTKSLVSRNKESKERLTTASTMSVLLRRLVRAHISASRIAIRPITTTSTNSYPAGVPLPSASAAPDFDSISVIQKPKEGVNFKEAKNTIVKPISDVHWALGEGYELGKLLKPGTGPLDRHDEIGRPTWGKWGVPIKLQTREGSSVITAWVPNF